MALINTSLPNLVQGVSQQPDTLRFDGQCEEQINALSSVADGLKKRPNARYIKNLLSSAIADGAFVHFINRDKNEKYVLIINNNVAQVFNILTFDSVTTTGSTTFTSNLLGTDYLYVPSGTKPKDVLKALTVGDTTFILNTTTGVAKQASTSGVFAASGAVHNNQAIVFIKQGHYQTDYTIEIDFTDTNNAAKTSKATYTSGPSASTGASPNARAGRIAFVLQEKIEAAVLEHGGTNGFTISDVDKLPTSSNGNTGDGIVHQAETGAFTGTIPVEGYGYPAFVISRTDGREFKIKVSDSKAGTAIGVVYKEVDSISDLPKSAPNNFKVKVRGSAEDNEDDYYLKFETNDGDTDFSDGGWVEDVGFGEENTLNNSTLPYKLVNTALNTFTSSACTWTTLQAGDSDTNPFPTFTGKTISNIFFYKNRLGFLSEGSVILSEAGEYFNFFRTTVRTLLDSDPIDVNVASTKVTKLKSAVGFQENLILFGERGQFVLKGGDLLTPKTVSITPVTNYETDTSTPPLELGSYIYFPFTRGSFSGVREFSVNANSDTFDSVEITAHVPQYIPSDILDMAGSTTENCICLVSESDNKSMYVYKYYWEGGQKILASWSKFTFPFSVIGFEFVESDLYIVATKNGKTELLVLPFEEKLIDSGASFNTYLDLRQSATVSGTSITLSFTPESDDVIQVYTRESGSTKAGALIPSTVSGSTVTVDASHDTTPVWVGIKYSMSYTFSEQMFKQRANQRRSPSGYQRHFLKGGTLFFDDTASFKVEVTPKARDTYTNTFTSNIVGSTTVGTLPIESGSFSFPIMSSAKDTVIKIVNDSALPGNFQSAEFESFIHSRSRRV
ncbi:MAG: hypothetical protein CBC27_03400 [Opitutia bacterium TMED67]|nr:MAG: hypothetical protein CBC27_03400 [Opitutae bacterium TMED67]